MGGLDNGIVGDALDCDVDVYTEAVAALGGTKVYGGMDLCVGSSVLFACLGGDKLEGA